MTVFEPGHDARILFSATSAQRVRISFVFSEDMDCDSITTGLSVNSTALNQEVARFDTASASCKALPQLQTAPYQGTFPGTFNYSIELETVFHGIHEIVLNNVTNIGRNRTMNVSTFFHIDFD